MTASCPPHETRPAPTAAAPDQLHDPADQQARLDHLFRRSRGDPRPHPLLALLQAYRAQQSAPGADRG